MTAYHENEAAVDSALKAAKTPEEVRKHGSSPLDTKSMGLLSVHVLTHTPQPTPEVTRAEKE